MTLGRTYWGWGILKVFILFFLELVFALTARTTKEIDAIQQLRPAVEGIVTENYMKEDAFLLQYLRTAHLDVEKAKELIQNTIKWRVQNKIDGIMDEENELDRELPRVFGIDRSGRPAILIRAAETDLRKAVITGKRDLASRSGLKLVEIMAARARALNATQVVAVIDLNGFSYRRHACRDCIAFGQEMAETIEPNYPGLAAAIIFINTPRVFEVVLNVIKAVLSASSKGALHVYGFDKAEWTEALLKWISRDQLSVLFGYDIKKLSNRHHHHLHNAIGNPEPRVEVSWKSDAANEYIVKQKLLTSGSVTASSFIMIQILTILISLPHLLL